MHFFQVLGDFAKDVLGVAALFQDDLAGGGQAATDAGQCAFNVGTGVDPGPAAALPGNAAVSVVLLGRQRFAMHSNLSAQQCHFQGRFKNRGVEGFNKKLLVFFPAFAFIQCALADAGVVDVRQIAGEGVVGDIHARGQALFGGFGE